MPKLFEFGVGHSSSIKRTTTKTRSRRGTTLGEATTRSDVATNDHDELSSPPSSLVVAVALAVLAVLAVAVFLLFLVFPHSSPRQCQWQKQQYYYRSLLATPTKRHPLYWFLRTEKTRATNPNGFDFSLLPFLHLPLILPSSSSCSSSFSCFSHRYSMYSPVEYSNVRIGQ